MNFKGCTTNGDNNNSNSYINLLNHKMYENNE